MDKLVRFKKYIEGVIDAELNGLHLGVIRTSEDTKIIDGLTKVLRNGVAPDCRSGSTRSITRPPNQYLRIANQQYSAITHRPQELFQRREF